jgi:hypothetical protein
MAEEEELEGFWAQVIAEPEVTKIGGAVDDGLRCQFGTELELTKIGALEMTEHSASLKRDFYQRRLM